MLEPFCEFKDGEDPLTIAFTRMTYSLRLPATGEAQRWAASQRFYFAKEMIMTVRIVRLGTERVPGEGIRIGTVRRPPRGVPKSEYASQNWYDVWFPNLAPSLETMKLGQSAKTEDEWKTFLRKYRAEMAAPEKSRTLDLLTTLSHGSNFSVGCYCADERRCHRSALRALLLERGAKVE